jgi:hypothetical protein
MSNLAIYSHRGNVSFPGREYFVPKVGMKSHSILFENKTHVLIGRPNMVFRK